MKLNDPLFDISGKVVALTGGTGVIGRAFALGLAERGAKVAILGRDIQKGEAIVAEIAAKNGAAIAVGCDVCDARSVEAAADTILSTLGGIDVLINGAGGNKKEATASADMSFFDLPVDAIKSVVDLNLLGTILPSQIFGRHMARQKNGVILNISSMNSFRPLTRIVGYSAAKAAVNNFTQWLAVHIAQNYSPEIRVNAIAPGFFETAQNKFLLRDEQGNLTARGQQIIDHTPAGRFGDPEDMLSTLVWLLSPASKFVTGIVVPVDGGFSAFSGV